MKRDGVIFLLENSTDYLFLLDQAFRRAEIFNPSPSRDVHKAESNAFRLGSTFMGERGCR